MAKRRVEENAEMENIVIDDSIQDMPMQVIPKHVAEDREEAPKKTVQTNDEPVNCLRNERVIVRFVPRPTAMVHDPRHILYGGMAENATRSFVVPRLSSTGMFKNILTDKWK